MILLSPLLQVELRSKPEKPKVLIKLFLERTEQQLYHGEKVTLHSEQCNLFRNSAR